MEHKSELHVTAGISPHLCDTHRTTKRPERSRSNMYHVSCFSSSDRVKVVFPDGLCNGAPFGTGIRYVCWVSTTKEKPNECRQDVMNAHELSRVCAVHEITEDALNQALELHADTNWRATFLDFKAPTLVAVSQFWPVVCRSTSGSYQWPLFTGYEVDPLPISSEDRWWLRVVRGPRFSFSGLDQINGLCHQG